MTVSVVDHPRSSLYSFVYGGRGVLLGGVRDDGENFAELGSCQCVLWLGLERRLPCVRLSSYSLLCGKQGGEDNMNELKGWIDDERPVQPLRGGKWGIVSEAFDFRTSLKKNLTHLDLLSIPHRGKVIRRHVCRDIDSCERSTVGSPSSCCCSRLPRWRSRYSPKGAYYYIIALQAPEISTGCLLEPMADGYTSISILFVGPIACISFPHHFQIWEYNLQASLIRVR